MSSWYIAYGQLRITGQASSAYIKANNGYSQYAVNHGRQTFAWRLDLFGDATISENIFFLSNIRVLQDQIFHVDLLELKVTDIASTGLNVEMGEIEIPFGNLGERRFPKSNPFYDLPLMNEHLTTLRSSDYQVWPTDDRYTTNENGVHILDHGLYDLGVKLSGSFGIFDYWVAIINGMVSATSTYSSNYGSSGLNPKSGIGTVVRISATPFTGLTLGNSFARGSFLREDISYAVSSEYDPSNMPQNAYEGDFDFSLGHTVLSGQVVYSEWAFKNELGSDLKTVGYTFEGRYTPVPRPAVYLKDLMITYEPPEKAFMAD